MKKIEKINDVFDRFYNARNHGHNGNNWWYPKPFVIAYNVKLHGMSKSIDDLRAILTPRQNEYYSDNTLYDEMNFSQNMEAEMLAECIKEMDGVKDVGYAGRSGGWIEVEYTRNFHDDNDETTDKNTINEEYKEAMKLEKNEEAVKQEIEKAHKNYMQYLNTDEYLNDIKENLLDDDDIADIYKQKAKNLLDKLK